MKSNNGVTIKEFRRTNIIIYFLGIISGLLLATTAVKYKHNIAADVLRKELSVVKQRELECIRGNLILKQKLEKLRTIKPTKSGITVKAPHFKLQPKLYKEK